MIATPVTDTGLEQLQDMKRLRVLVLAGKGISDAGLRHLKGLTSLTTLALHSRFVTEAGLAHLAGLTKLDTLYIADMDSLRSPIFDELAKALPELVDQ